MEKLNFNALSGLLARPVLVGPVALIIGYILYSLFLRPNPASKLAATLPIVGVKRGEWFPLLRARWRNGFALKPALLAAYRDHKHEACLLPILGGDDYVMLPVQDMQWYLDQPDTSIAIQESIRHSLQLHHTVADQGLVTGRGAPSELIKKLTRETGNVVPDMLDEIGAALDDLWGGAGAEGEGEAKEVCVYSTMQRAVGRVTNRVFVGLPLCRDDRLLDNGVAFAVDVPLGAAILKLVWAPLRPLAALFVTLPGRIHTRRFYAALRGEIQRRIGEYNSHSSRGEGPGSQEEKRTGGFLHQPNDFLQWSIQQAAAEAETDPYLSRPETMAGRLLMLNMAAIHTSSFSITSALLDLACAGPVDGPRYVAELRAEIEAALAERPGQAWDKRALADMPKLDSLFRESARVNSFVTVATVRTVVARDGVTTPGGVHLPRGTAVACHGYAVMHDGERYPEPERFRPFRFAEKRAAVVVASSAAAGEKGKEQGTGTGTGTTGLGGGYLEKARQAFTTTSAEYTGFGHGRHACPGRFFASAELRLMLAYVVMHYDFEFVETRPRNVWFTVQRVPDMKATVRVKRRPGW